MILILIVFNLIAIFYFQNLFELNLFRDFIFSNLILQKYFSKELWNL
jgi:hypothetical protein